MGSMKDLIGMIPGMDKLTKNVEISDDAFKPIEAIINSMTPKERANPDIINQSRRLRIAKGSGTKIEDVNRLIKQFDQTRKMMKMVSGMGSSRMAQMAAAMKMKGGMPKM
jgi:signal recognition particle subunit SRP54